MATIHSDDDLLTTDEVVAWTRFSKHSFERWRALERGGPPFLKFEKKVLYRRGAVREWLEQFQRVPVPAPTSPAAFAAAP
jgi:hypothetical protein